MLRVLLAGFLIAHGLVHPAVWATPNDPAKPEPFDPGRSWALTAVHVAARPAHSTSVVMAWATAVGFTPAGGGWWDAGGGGAEPVHRR